MALGIAMLSGIQPARELTVCAPRLNTKQSLRPGASQSVLAFPQRTLLALKIEGRHRLMNGNASKGDRGNGSYIILRLV
jgi:hypothetical protein